MSEQNTEHEEEEEEDIEPYFSSLDEFVSDYLAPIYNRATSAGASWCPQWWMHQGAVVRFTALWQSWEEMRINGGASGLAQWLTQYGDPIMATLFDPEGPFKGCSPTRGHRQHEINEDDQLPVVPPEEGLFEPRE